MLLNMNFSSTSWICCVVGLPAAGLGGTKWGSSVPPLSMAGLWDKGFDFPSPSGLLIQVFFILVCQKLLPKMKVRV